MDDKVYEVQFEDGTDIDSYTATSYAEGFGDGEYAHPKDVIRAWSYLIGTGLVYKLQGWFGRTANDYIARGLISETGTVDWERIGELNFNNDYV